MAKKVTFDKKTKEEIEKILKQERKKLVDLEFSFAGSRPKNVHEKKTIRKTIARGLTALAQMKISS